MSEYRNYLKWTSGFNLYEIKDFFFQNNLIYYVCVPSEKCLSNQEVDELTIDKWSGYTEPATIHTKGRPTHHYYFRSECDAMAIKLKTY